MKKIYILFLLGSLTTFGQTQIGDDIDGEAVLDRSGKSVSMSSEGNIVAIGAYRNNGNGNDSGHVRIYQNVAGVWTQIGDDIDGEAAGDESGWSVSLSADGSVVAIGAHLNDGNGNDSGHVRIYQNIAGVWTQVGDDIDGEDGDRSGWSVSLSADGSVVAIGIPSNNRVRIYQNVSGVWTQIGDEIDGEYASRTPNVSLSSDGNIVAVGSPFINGNDDLAGRVRIYQNVSGVWTQIGADIEEEAPTNFIEISVSLSSDGSVVAIGDPGNDGNGNSSGRVRIFQNVSGVWTQMGNDINGESINDQSGTSVSLSADGSVVAIGAPLNWGNGQDSGQVRIYQNVAGVWTQRGVDIDGEGVWDRNGTSVSLSADGSEVAMGAPNNYGNGTLPGHVRVYDLSAVLASDTFVLNNFMLFPNPSNGIVKISLDTTIQLEKVNIYNTLGQLVQSENTKQLDVSNLAKGTYQIEVLTNQGKATKSLIVD